MLQLYPPAHSHAFLQVWGCEGLYVADASVLPTCPGANPMITIEATALMIARGIVARRLGRCSSNGDCSS